MQTQTKPGDYLNNGSSDLESKPTDLDLLRISSIYTAEDLDNISKQGLDIMNQYSLTEENVKSLKERGKWFFVDQILIVVDGKTEEQLKRESSSIFVTNIILATKIRKLIEDNGELKEKLRNIEVS